MLPPKLSRLNSAVYLRLPLINCADDTAGDELDDCVIWLNSVRRRSSSNSGRRARK